MANVAASDSAAANTSKKRKTTDAETAPAKKRATTNGVAKKATAPKAKAPTKKEATTKAASKAALEKAATMNGVEKAEPPKRAAPKKVAAKAAAPKEAVAKEPAAKKAAPEKAAPKKAAPAKAAPKKAAPAKKAAPKKAAPVKAAPAKKAAPKKVTAAKAASEIENAETAEPNGTTEELVAAQHNTTSAKRKAEDETEQEPPKKKTAVKKAAAPKKGAAVMKEEDVVQKPKLPAPRTVINHAPTEKLNVYVFGEGSGGELGLGAVGNVIDVKRPRLNPNLSAESVGVVQVAAGGMHAVALTHDNVILTWGVNDQGALGRDTKGEEKLRDMDEDNSDAGSDTGLNPSESTPRPVLLDDVPDGTIWSSVAAGDSITMAVTDTGHVYGCGTFRSNDGILGFSHTSRVQNTLTLVKELKHITSIVCGDNHVLALDKKGNVFAWGSGQQNQLGRRVIERTRMNGLVPREFGLPRNKITAIAAGGYHSFAIDNQNDVWSWGLNTYGETGCEDDVGEDEAVVLKPSRVGTLAGRNVVAIDGGAHHSIAVTANGETLAFGRCDGSQSGLSPEGLKKLPDGEVHYDEKGRARILIQPTALPGIPRDAAMVAVGVDTNIVVTKSGKAYSWGFSTNYQTGLGTEDDVPTPTLIENTAVKDKVVVWAGAGGQYGMLACKA